MVLWDSKHASLSLPLLLCMADAAGSATLPGAAISGVGVAEPGARVVVCAGHTRALRPPATAAADLSARRDKKWASTSAPVRLRPRPLPRPLPPFAERGGLGSACRKRGRP